MKFCKYGHAMTLENTKTWKTGGVTRTACYTCSIGWSRKSSNYQGNMCNKDKTHCPQGHEYNEENTKLDKNGGRSCRTCRRERDRKRRNYKGKLPPGERMACPRGHAYTVENTGLMEGRRYCRTCHKLRSRSRREERMGIDMTYSESDERLTRVIFGNHCFKCESSEDLQIDHHFPLHQGFRLSIDNAVLLCGQCNLAKLGKNPYDFYSLEEMTKLHYILGMCSNFSEDV